MIGQMEALGGHGVSQAPEMSRTLRPGQLFLCVPRSLSGFTYHKRWNPDVVYTEQELIGIYEHKIYAFNINL